MSLQKCLYRSRVGWDYVCCCRIVSYLTSAEQVVKVIHKWVGHAQYYKSHQKINLEGKNPAIKKPIKTRPERCLSRAARISLEKWPISVWKCCSWSFNNIYWSSLAAGPSLKEHFLLLVCDTSVFLWTASDLPCRQGGFLGNLQCNYMLELAARLCLASDKMTMIAHNCWKQFWILLMRYSKQHLVDYCLS